MIWVLNCEKLVCTKKEAAGLITNAEHEEKKTKSFSEVII